MSQPSRARQLRRRAMQQVDQSSQEPKDSLGKWDQQITDIEQFQRLQQRQQRHLDRPPSYLDSIAAPQSSISSSSPSNSEVLASPSQQVSYNLIPSLFSSDDQNPQYPQDDDEDLTWLLAVVLATALLISLFSLIRVLRQKFGLFSLFGNSDSHGAHGGHGHGLSGGSSRYPGHGPHQVPSEDDPDPDAQLNENDERWALMTEAQRLAFDSTRAFQAAHPPLSVPTDISLSQYLSIQEKGVSAWEFEASFDNQRVQVHDRTELSFPPMNHLEASVQTNLPMPKQQEVYYWEVKMFEKSPDTVVSVGVSTKPYPNTRLPGWSRHSVAYFSKDGRKYCNSPFSGYPYGPIYFEGDVIGCGYRPRTGTIFFTRNGRRLEDAYTGLRFNLFPTVGATGPCILHVNLGQSGFVFVEANVKKWGLAPASGSLVPPPAYGSERGSILLEAGSAMPPAPPTRRPVLQSSQSRARIEAAEVLVQIDEVETTGDNSGSEYSKKAGSSAKQHISLANMSVPHQGGVAPPQYSSQADPSESDDETTALIAETISRPVGRGRSGTMNSTASGSGSRR
ncbi:Rsp5p-dependent ubiquitination, sorting of cargo proteins at the multivesicular body [Entomortierella chlamydospora]|uniref:Rsp5p-dependent ubiquitination, sorting of cargo proteins at the multivesicular body n=1 Tax=Entomortierella chlamydospora TaxID=101097 RepID=A0A9P6MYE2_9FUNG|nr:Rsp5p-dependent ubiquitination, sorting of cargo proteins at the multivesicular body [Entomortierella chlamydospora]KAG0018409.1 Rsp5p-dependent ubiquitination, sorting of cargo proteins at the multivesicular body [Entomortierella chlamydospora]